MKADHATMLSAALVSAAVGLAHQDDVRQALAAVLVLHQPRREAVLVRCAGHDPLSDALYPCPTVVAAANALGVTVTVDGELVHHPPVDPA